MNTLYKYIYIFITLLGISFLISCDNNIDLNADGIISADGYFTSSEDYEKALNSVYGRVNVNNFDLWLDGVSDDGLVTHSWNRGYDLGRGIGNSASSFPRQKWENGYVSVQRANNVIGNIDIYDWPDGTSNLTRNTYLSEARSLRAYFYLDLVTLFGNIMFYEENPATVADAENIPQVEPKTVFDFILKELEESIPSLPDKPTSKSKFSKPAARLLRARAASYAAGYLNDKDYFNITLSETEELLKTAPELGDYESLFVSNNENIDEVIFVKRYSADSKNNWGDWYNNSIGGYCVTTPTKALVDAYEYIGQINPNLPYENKDPRLYATIYVPGSIIRGKYYNTIPFNTVEKNGKVYFDSDKDYGAYQDLEVSFGDVLGEAGGGEWNKTPTGLSYKKYYQEAETWNTYNSYVVFRYAEAYLLRAEALVETNGNLDEAKSLIKIIRERAGNNNDIETVITNIYNGSLLNLIRNERRIEMAQEGVRLLDIRRWKILLDVMNKPVEGIEYRDFSGSTPVKVVHSPAVRDTFTERDYWWPIPQAEMDLDKSGRIIQNNGWK